MQGNGYRVNEVFYSLQGEGAKAGSATVFVRLSGCNLTCRAESEGFDCDTEFVSGRTFAAAELAEEVVRVAAVTPLPSVTITGGEPMLQLDVALLDALRNRGVRDLWLETNGTVAMPGEVRDRLSWVACSPKTAEHTLRLGEDQVDELRYVRRCGQAIPRPRLKAGYLYLSPACGPDGFDADDIAWCVQLVRENPWWRLSMQQHKLWGVR